VCHANFGASRILVNYRACNIFWHGKLYIPAISVDNARVELIQKVSTKEEEEEERSLIKDLKRYAQLAVAQAL